MNSLSQWAGTTRSAFPTRQNNAFSDFLGFIDLEFLTACEYTNASGYGPHIGRKLQIAHSHLLGAGGTYTVYRIPYVSFEHSVGALGNHEQNPKPKFVVLKQQSIDVSNSLVEVQDIYRIRSAMVEMKILRYEPIRKHPNIINLYQMRWDIHDDFKLVSPSIMMEYGDFGTLADFQDHELLALNWRSKKGICLDVAEGLQFLHDCGIIHGDLKPEHPGGGYLAKLSDFGSSLIGVFNSSPPQKVLGTPGWGAPESGFELEPLELRKQDVYSFGLLVWAIALNGIKPWHMLMRVADNVVEVANSTQRAESHSKLTYVEFDGLKATNNGDLLIKLAKETLEQCHPGDVDYCTVEYVLHQTLCNDLDK